MISLIVVLTSHAPESAPLTYALSSDAAPALVKSVTSGPASEPALQDAIEHGSAHLSQLPACDEVVAVVPARMLSWHKVVLPKVPKARWRTALEGALEERLLDEPHRLHFALEPAATAGSPVWVCTCSKAWLKSALDSFEAAGRQVMRIVPEHAPLLTGSDPCVYVTTEAEQPWVVRVCDAGVDALPLCGATLDAFGLPADPEGHKARFDGKVFAAPQAAEAADALLGCRSEVRSGPSALVAAARTPWNIAQFDLESTGSTRLIQKLAQTWSQLTSSPTLRPARWGLLTLMVVQLAGLNAWAIKERSALRDKQSEMQTLLTGTFPAVRLVVDPPVQLEREVTALRRSVGAVAASDLEPLLAHVAEHAATGAVPAAISYSPGELRLKGLGVEGAVASTLTQGLADAGYAARIDGSDWIVTVRAPSAVPSSSGAPRP